MVKKLGPLYFSPFETCPEFRQIVIDFMTCEKVERNNALHFSFFPKVTRW